jgi:hypothetical protein
MEKGIENRIKEKRKRKKLAVGLICTTRPIPFPFILCVSAQSCTYASPAMKAPLAGGPHLWTRPRVLDAADVWARLASFVSSLVTNSPSFPWRTANGRYGSIPPPSIGYLSTCFSATSLELSHLTFRPKSPLEAQHRGGAERSPRRRYGSHAPGISR